MTKIKIVKNVLTNLTKYLLCYDIYSKCNVQLYAYFIVECNNMAVNVGNIDWLNNFDIIHKYFLFEFQEIKGKHYVSKPIINKCRNKIIIKKMVVDDCILLFTSFLTK